MFLLLAGLSTAEAACDLLVDDDLSDGSTVAHQEGGAFVTGGWQPQGGSLVYDGGSLHTGWVELTVSNLDEAGVAESDLFELFTGPSGDFQDGAADRFALVKIAGVEGYVGRIKTEWGTEYSSGEVGGWSGERDWDPGQTYTLRLDFEPGRAVVSVDGETLVDLDTSAEGSFSFQSLRVPNNGSYQADPNLADLVVHRVRVCGDGDSGDGGSGDGGGGDGGTGDGGTSDGGTGDGGTSDGGTADGGTGDGGTGDGGTGDGGTGDGGDEAPVVMRFELVPTMVEEGASWQVDWAIEGDWITADVCLAGSSGSPRCTPLESAQGSLALSSAGLSPGDYAATVQLVWDGGVLETGPRTVTVTRACGCAAGPGAGAGLLLPLALLLRRRRPC